MTEREILNNLIEYVSEFKGNEDTEEKIYFWTEVIGMTKKQMKEYKLI